MNISTNVAGLIGNTPLVELHSVTDDVRARVVVKVEYFNPGGSSKDRIAERIITAAEHSGQLRPGGTIVEPTSGNTGVGLALVAQQRGYRTIFVVPDKVSEDKRAVLRAYGAEVIVTPTEAGPDDPRSYYAVSDRLAQEIPGHSSQINIQILMDQRVIIVLQDRKSGVIPIRNSHTLWPALGPEGPSQARDVFFKEASQGQVQIIGADPEGSIYSNPEDVHQYLVEGVGEDFYPQAFDPSIPDEVVQVSDAEAFEMTRRMAREEGLLVGGSSGMAVAAALKSARMHGLDENSLMVVLLPDSGRGYLSQIFSDDWMRENGFADVVVRTSSPSALSLM
jgi:cystathionine beta-synthase